MSRKQCPTCKHRTAVRRMRPRLLRSPLALLIRYFPWQCTMCGNSFYSKDRGLRPAREATAHTGT